MSGRTKHNAIMLVVLVLRPANSLNKSVLTTLDHARRDSFLYRPWFLELTFREGPGFRVLTGGSGASTYAT